MRAARLLQILLLLQNRGKLSSAQLADELEVARRTILRDVDAMTEAGLPVIVHQGSQGGIELGFNYRSRLTGLARDEAEAMALILARPFPHLAALGLDKAGKSAGSKLFESFPDLVRTTMTRARTQFQFEEIADEKTDPRIAVVAEAIRQRKIVRLNARSSNPRIIHPVALNFGSAGWAVLDELDENQPIPIKKWGDLNISAKVF